MVGSLAVFGALFVPAGHSADDKKEIQGGSKVVISPTEKDIDAINRSLAAQQISALVNAVKLYETTYSVLPIGDETDEIVRSTGADLVDILMGRDSDDNPREIVFIKGKPAKKAEGDLPPRSGMVAGANGSKRLVDPWGNEYAVILDSNHDREIEIPGIEDRVRAGVVCWSYGKPKDPKDPKSAMKNPPKEWIASWDEPAPKKMEKKNPFVFGLFKVQKAARMKRVEHDLRTFKTALDVYRLNSGAYPCTEQGLGALVKKPTKGKIPKSWMPMLKSEVLDPWDNPYGYRYPPKHNAEEPDVWSFGPDGKDGTEDDMGNW